MKELLTRLRELGARIKNVFLSLSLNQKVLFGGAALLVIVAIVMLTAGGGATYETLYTDLDSKDAAAIVKQLDTSKTIYKLANNGTSILVPSDIKDKIRIQLAGDNLPSGTAGFELFQQTSFGETESDKKVKYQMALQGELARTIQSIDKIKVAKINLALPEQSLFTDQQQVPKASVVLNVKMGESLSSKEVLAITNLVANSVDRLTKENVVIVDQNGTLLADNSSLGDINASDSVKLKMEMKRQFEQEKQQAIQSMLDTTLGKDNAVVRVSADINLDNKQEKAQTFYHDDNGPFVRSESISKESSTNANAGASGTPGTTSNVPQYQQSTTGATNSSADKSSKTTNYEITETNTTTQFAPGDVKYDYLTVSVLVNNAAIQNVNLGTTDQDRADKIRTIVAAAIGLRENRPNEKVSLNNNISVAFMDFKPTPEPATASPSVVAKTLKSPLTPVLLVILSLLVIMMVGLKKRKEDRHQMQELAGETFTTIADEEINIEQLYERELSPEEKERQKIRQEVDRIVDKSPDSAADVIKAWLLEDSR